METEAIKIIKIVEKEVLEKGIIEAQVVFPSENVYPVAEVKEILRGVQEESKRAKG